jgi:uridine kinase
VTQRGRTEAFVKSQFEETVIPSRERYVEPSRANADLVVDGTAPVDQAVEAVLARL